MICPLYRRPGHDPKRSTSTLVAAETLLSEKAMREQQVPNGTGPKGLQARLPNPPRHR